MESTFCRHRRRPQRSSRAPGSRGTRPWSGTPASAGIEVLGELELGWRLLPNEFIAVTGHERKDDHGRADRRDAPGRRRARWPWPATSARRSARWRARSTRRATVVCEASSFQLEDSDRFRARGGRVPQLLRRTTSTATGRRRRTSTRSCASSPTSSRDDVAVLNGDEPALERDLGAARSGSATDPTARCGSTTAASVWRDEPLIDVDEVRLRGRSQPRQRDGGRGRVPRARRRRRGACAPRCASSPACRTASSTSPRSAASRT